jgi:predicted MFS family arabinose efflux permease
LAGDAQAPLLVAVAGVVGAASVVFDIGGFAYIPTLVDEPDLAGANRAIQGSTTAAQVGGPGIAGGLAQLVGPALAVAVDAASYLASAAGIAAARRPEPAPPAPEAGVGVLTGLRTVAANPLLRALATHATIYNGMAQILTVNLVVFAVTDRGLSAGQFGLALSAAGAGAFLGTMCALRLADRVGYGRAFATSLVLSTGAPLLIAVLPGRGTTLAIALGAVQFVAGTGLGSANVLSVTMRQIVAPRGSLARTNGGYRLLNFGVIPLGSAAGGLIGQAVGSRFGVAVGSVGLAVSALPMLTRRIRSLGDPAEAATPVRADAGTAATPVRADAGTAATPVPPQAAEPAGAPGGTREPASRL